MALRSSRWGRQGMRTRSAARAAVREALSELGEVSMTAKAGALLFGLFEDDGEAVGLGGLDDGGLVLAEVLPGGGAGLGVEVDEDAGLAGALGGDGKVEREGGFAHAPLLGDDRDCLHILLSYRR